MQKGRLERRELQRQGLRGRKRPAVVLAALSLSTLLLAACGEADPMEDGGSALTMEASLSDAGASDEDEFYSESDEVWDTEGEEEYFEDGGEDDYVFTGLAGTAWDFVDDEISMVFYDDGTGCQMDKWDPINFTYTWDGETLILSTEWIDIEGYLRDDGTLVVGDSVLVRVDEPTYTPGMYLGGCEEEMKGVWVHNSGYYTLRFDGGYSVGYQTTYDSPVGVGAAAGTYTYDGETVVVTFLNDDDELQDYEGYLDGDGDLVISLWGEDGYYVWDEELTALEEAEEVQ